MKLHCNGDTISEEIGEEMDTTRPHSELDSKLCHYIRPDDGATDGRKGGSDIVWGGLVDRGKHGS